jgi:hypothetical protein
MMARKLHFRNLVKYFSEELLERSLFEIHKKLDKIGFSILIAVIFSLILVFLLRYIAKIMIIVFIILSCLGSIGKFYYY